MSDPTHSTRALARGDAPAEELLRLWGRGERPEVDAFLAQAGPLPPAELAAVLRVDQGQRWRAGERVPAEEYLGRHPGLRAEPSAAVDLVYAEYLLRERLGERPDPGEFLRRFPEHAATLAGQIDLHRAVAGGDPAATGPPGPGGETLAAPPEGGPGCPCVPGCEVLSELGRGGMGVVYLARQTALGRLVALKMILAGGHADAAERRRFQTEAEAIARLSHPNIVQIHEVGEHDGLPFLALEYCPGGSLEKKLAGTPLPPRQAANQVGGLARAMHAAHQKGVIHRDLKPSNVLFAEGGTPKVSDFGLAKKLEEAGQTQTGVIMGTPSYMAPEQAQGDKAVGPPADVYALGAILYECLTGRPPFKAAAPLDTLLQVVTEEPVPPRRLQPGVPRDLETICLKCLQKEPHRRYGSAEALAEDLERWLGGEPIRARPVGGLERALKWARRQPAVAALLAAVVLVTAAGLGGVLWKYQDAERQRGIAQEERDNAQEQETAARVQGESAERRRREAVQMRQRAEKGETLARQQLERSRRSLYTAQLMRVAGLWDRDPVLARELLEDSEVCPPELRDFAWGLHYRLCRDWVRRRLTSQAVCLAYSPDGKTLALGGFKAIHLHDVASGEERSIPTGHKGWAQCLEFSPDGTMLASSGERTVRLWDVKTGNALLPPMKEHRGMIRGLAFSPDGKAVASCGAVHHAGAPVSKRWSQAQLLLWDVKTGTVRPLVERGSTGINSVRFSPDGKTLAAGVTHVDHVQLFDLPSGKERGIIRNGFGWIDAIAFSRDGRVLAYSGEAQTIWLCDPNTRKRLGTLRGHTDRVAALDFSSDGTLLVSCAHDRTVRLWDVSTGRQRAVLRMPAGVGDVALSPDGKSLAATSAGRVVLWDLVPGPGSAAFAGRTRGAFAFAPDCRTLAAGDRAGNVTLLDPSTGKARATLGNVWWPGAAGPIVTCVAFSADGALVAGGRADGTVKVWEMGTRRERATLGEHKGGAGAVAFSPDGQALAAGDGHGAVVLWDLASRKRRFLLERGDRKVTALAFAASGRALVVGDVRGGIERWDLSGRRRVAGREAVDPGPVRALALTRDGKTLASAHRSAAYLWDLPSLAPRATLRGGAFALAFTPGGRTLAVGKQDHTVGVWDVGTAQLRAWLPGYTREVTALAFTPDGRTLASASSAVNVGVWVEGGEAILWRTARDAALRTLRAHGGAVHAVACTPDGDRIFAGGPGGGLKVWDVAERPERATALPHPAPVWCLAATADGKMLASGGQDRTIRLHDLRSGKPLDVLVGHEGLLQALAFSPDGRLLASGSADRTVRLWDVSARKPRGVILGKHQSDAVALAFSPDGRTLVSGSGLKDEKTGKWVRGELKVWDVAGRTHKRSLEGHEGLISCLAFAPGGAGDGGASPLLASGSLDGTVWLWDLEPGKPQAVFGRHQGPIYDALFTPAGARLITAGGGGVIKVWDLAARREITTLEGHDDDVSSLALTRDGQVLVSGSRDGTVKRWKVPRRREGGGHD